MATLDSQLKHFHRVLILRRALIAALWGIVIALAILVAAPWLREWLGLPGFWISFSLPVILPGIWIAYSIRDLPDRRAAAMLADSWHVTQGTVTSAWELEQQDADSPFLSPVKQRAERHLKQVQVPVPTLAVRLMIAFVVLVACLFVSRSVHAYFADEEQKAEQQAAENTVAVSEQEADKLADDAAEAAEKAKELETKAQEQLADDIEQAARNAQAGGDDKSEALQEANALKDRADNQVEAHENREAARDTLEDHAVARDLADAIKDLDTKKINFEIKDLAEDVHRPDGSIDIEKAKALREAVEEAKEKAPLDHKLQRAADALQFALDDNALKRSMDKRKELEQQAEDAELGPEAKEAAKAAKEILKNADKKFLEQALKDFADQASELRDAKQGDDLKELQKMLEEGKIDPKDAKELVKQAQELSKRLQLDADALKKMLQEGKDFEGLEELAKEIIKGQQGQPIPKGDEQPDWVRKGADTESGSGSGKGKDSTKSGERSSREVEGGEEVGVDTTDTGEGTKDPDAKEEELDPNKATDEKAGRDTTGNKSDSKSINTREDRARLPRKYKDAARKYFER
ncbi:MAG: hypothetical protein ACYTDT_07795 [Planctomycetota bacterium]|jgi:hypothetical protein